MKQIKFLTIFVMAFALCNVFAACSSDDDENDVTESVVGNSYTYRDKYYNDEGLQETDNIRITFTNGYSCTWEHWGTDYYWDFGYKKNHYSSSGKCSYTVSGSKITIVGSMNFAVSPLVLTNEGDCLSYKDFTFLKD